MFVTDLSANEFIRISGADAEKFLQGQVSCNMTQLSEHESKRGVLCNLKGRVIADFRILKTGEDFLLQTQPAMAQKILDTLSRYAVFSKVELQRDDSINAAFGVQGSDAELGSIADMLSVSELPALAGAIIQTPEAILAKPDSVSNRLEIWCRNDELSQTLQQHVEPAAIATWTRANMQAGIIHVTTEQSEEFTPQLLNYDISGVIDFKKGCYTGQEVVARMFYRGTAKKRLFLLSTTKPDSKRLERGNYILQAGGRETDAQLLQTEPGDGSLPALALAVLPTEIDGSPLSVTEPLTLLKDHDDSVEVILNALPYT